MTNPQPGPAIRKAPDTDRHPALAAYPQIDLRDETVRDETTDSAEVTDTVDSPIAPGAASGLEVVADQEASNGSDVPAAAPKKSRWRWFFSRS